MNKNKIQKNFENTIERFNFHKIKLVMNALDWEWGTKEIPLISEMKEVVERLYESALDYLTSSQKSHTIQSGGFSVEIDGDNDSVTILFIAEEQCSLDYE